MNRRKQGVSFRLVAARLILLSVFALLAFRLWQLQIVEGARFRQAAEGNRQRMLPTTPLRGHIYDRDGRILAENVPSFSVLTMAEDLPEDPSVRTPMLDRLCALLQCWGSLQVDPTKLDTGIRTALYRWLPDYLEVTRLEGEEFLYAMEHPFSLTLQLNEEEAGWIRAQMDVTTGLSYSNALEQALYQSTTPPYLPVMLMENIPRDYALVLTENHQAFPGIFVQAEPIRRYPTGALTAHIIGYTGRISPDELVQYNPDSRSGDPLRYLENDRIGKAGVEQVYEDLLRGELGIREIQVDATGHPIGAPMLIRESESGLDIVLTLDTDLQEKTTEILQRYITQAERGRRSYYRPVHSGAAVVIDPRNGQILAMVSLPSYDNNAFVQGLTADEFLGLINDPRHPLLNRAIGGEFPPGSTFKIVVAGAGLQEGVITPETRIYDRGVLLIPNRYDPTLPPQRFPCWARGGHGAQTIVTALQNSCNVFFFTVAGGTPENQYEDALGVDRLSYYAHAYGMGQSTGLGFPGEASGLIPSPEWKEEALGEAWVQGDLYNMGIGQGNVLVTPLQLVNAAAAIANGGTLYQPQLLLRVQDQQGQVVQEFAPQVLRRIPIDPEYLALVREGMRRVITHRYYGNLPSTSVAIAGKTGTAEFGPLLGPNDRQAHAWFVGFAPYEDPQLAAVVIVEGGWVGEVVALPAVIEIVEYYFTRGGPPGDGSD